MSSGHGAVAVSVWGRGQKNFEIVDADKPSFFARITDAELPEISLVDCAANPPALVYSRTPVPPLQFFDAALRYVDAIKTLVTRLRRCPRRPRAKAQMQFIAGRYIPTDEQVRGACLPMRIHMTAKQH